MALTPRDVADKQFRRTFRGYDVLEVDAFLDEVEAEITRLMTAAAAPAPSRGPAGGLVRGTADAAAPAPAAPASPVDVPTPSSGTGPPATAASQPPLASLEGQETALRTLLMAQRTADQAVAEAREEAEQLLAAAREQADSVLSAARDEAASTVAAAREQAEDTRARTAQEAERVERELAQRRSETVDQLERERVRLEAGVAELRAFEREYRSRLRSYLEGQLRDLDGAGGSDDTGVGVPLAAGAAAVGRPGGGAVRIGPASGAPGAAGAADGSPAPDPAAPTAEH